MTTAIGEKKEFIKSHFEANMLDGDDVDDCGRAMLSAKDVLEYIYELIETLEENTWISVEERLPEEEKEYLVIDTYGKSFVCGYTVSCGFDSDVFYTDELTHWKPLPEPPTNNQK